MPATIGQAAPAFAADAVMPDGSFKSVKLADYKGAPRVERLACQPWLTQARRDAGKYVVLFFYPLDFTFVCPVSAPAPRVRTAGRVVVPQRKLLPGRLQTRKPGVLTAISPRSPADGDLRLFGPREGLRGGEHRGACRASSLRATTDTGAPTRGTPATAFLALACWLLGSRWTPSTLYDWLLRTRGRGRCLSGPLGPQAWTPAPTGASASRR